MEFSQEIKDSIKNNMLHITTIMKNKPRNYLNKQLQDAVCNYFLENYAAPFLKEEYKLISGRELRKKIEKSLPCYGKKYINLLNKFKSEIQRVNKGEQYRTMLSSVIYEEEKYAYETEEWCTLQRKKILALLLTVHWDQEDILNFYDMWNSLYPNDPLIKQKLSKEEKEKQKKKVRNLVNNSDYCQFPTEGNRLNDSLKGDSSSKSPISLNRKRSNLSFNISPIFEKNNSIQIQPNQIEQQQNQFDHIEYQIQKKVINNRIFEDLDEQKDVFYVQIEQTLPQLRYCEAVKNTQMKQQVHQDKFEQPTEYFYSEIQSSQPCNNDSQQQLQNEQRKFKQEFISTESLESNYYSEQTSFFVNENLITNSQICQNVIYCSQNEAYSQFNNEYQSFQQDHPFETQCDTNNYNSIFLPNVPVFINDYGNLIENTLFSILNF